MKKFIIYKLTSSEFPEEIRYIGVTTQTLQKRFYHHKYCTKNQSKRNLPVHKWMWSVYNKGFDVIITQIDECLENLWEEKEQFYIKSFKFGGHLLLNIDKGGNGVITKEKREIDGIKRSIDSHKVAVVALYKDGNLFKEFSSQKEAAEDLNIKSKSAINNVLQGRSKTCAGYIWVTKENYLNNNYSLDIFNKHKKISFYQFNLEGDLLKEFNSKKELLGKSNSSALDKALSNQTIYRNSYWSYNNKINIKI